MAMLSDADSLQEPLILERGTKVYVKSWEKFLGFVEVKVKGYVVKGILLPAVGATTKTEDATSVTRVRKCCRTD